MYLAVIIYQERLVLKQSFPSLTHTTFNLAYLFQSLSILTLSKTKSVSLLRNDYKEAWRYDTVTIRGKNVEASSYLHVRDSTMALQSDDNVDCFAEGVPH